MNLFEAERLNQKTQSLRILSIVVGLFLILSHAFVIYSYYSLPLDGLSGTAFHSLKKNESVPGFLIQKIIFPELEGDISIGDQIVAVNSTAIGTGNEWFEGKSVFNSTNLKRGQTFQYTLQRNGETFEQVVSLRTITLNEFVSSYWISLIVVLSYLFIGMVVVLKQPLRPLSWVFYVFITFASFQMLGGDTFLPISGSHKSEFIYTLYYSFYFPLSTILLFHFATEFPDSLIIEKRKKQIFWLCIYGIYFTIFGGASLYALMSEKRALLLSSAEIGTYIGVLFGIISAVTLLYRYYKAENSTERAQIRLPIISLTLVLIIGLVFYEIGWLVFKTTIFDYEIIILLTLVLPISIAVSVIQYHLFTIDRLITKGILYGLLTAFLSSTYIIVSFIFSFLLNETLAIQVPSWQTLTSLGVFVLLLQPAKDFLQKIIDRVFYRSPSNISMLIHEVSKELAIVNSYTEIESIIREKLQSILGVQSTNLYIVQENHFEPIVKESIFDDQQLLPILENMYTTANDFHKGVQVVNEYSANLRDISLHALEISMIVPLIYENQLIGVLVVSKKKSDLAYTKEELEAVELLSYPLAIGLKNTQAFETIIREKEQSNRIMESISEGVMLLNKEGIITQINSVTSSLFTEIRSESIDIIGRPYTDLFQLVDRLGNPISLDPIAESLRTNTPSRNNVQIDVKEGIEPRPVTLYLNPLTSMRDSIDPSLQGGMLITIYDRTEDERLLSIKDSFIATITHEIRTPIVVIKAFPDLFKSKLPEKLPEEAEKLLNMLDSSVSRLNSRVDQMAQITSVQTGGYAFNAESVELNNAIQERLQVHLENALSKETTITFGSDETHERYGIIDTRAFGEILDELIENAIESTKKGTITISVEASDRIDSIRHADNNTHNYWVISVTDSGKGISPEIKELLFTPFIQQGGTLYRDESKGGLGLGLYFVSLLVEKTGGKIWFTSELGKGTTFYFTVPSSEIK